MGKIFLNSIQYCGGNGNSAAILHKYTATLTSSQYGWFTFVDENGNVIAKDSTKTPVLATALDGAKYYFGAFFVYEAENRYLFKVYDINDSSAHGYEGTSKTLTFDLIYVESSSAFGGHSYNTTEQVVGTWIDGSPVYEKSYTGTITATQLTLETFTDGIVLIGGDGAIMKPTGSQMTLGILPNATMWSCGIHFTSNSLKLFTTSEVSNGTYRITVRYTKTST